MSRRPPSGEPVRLRDVGLPRSPALDRLALLAAWRRVVGATLADRSRVERRAAELVVAVPDERWALAVERMAASLLERLGQEDGARGVRSLAVWVDPTLRPRPPGVSGP